MKSFQKILIVFLFTIFSNSGTSQCCSQGTPMGGVGNLGTLTKGSIQIVTFYKYSESISQKEDNPYNIKKADFNYIGSNLSYGITNKLTFELELGYFINKTQYYQYNGNNFDMRGFGMSNGFASLKHRLYKSENVKWEIVGGLGLKFPFSKEYQIVDGVQLPIDNQPSTGAFGLVPKLLIYRNFPDKDLNLFFVHRTDYNFKNQSDYTYGHGFTSSLFVAKKLNFISCNALGVLQFRHTSRLKDILKDGQALESTGSNILFIAPQFGYTLFDHYFLSLAYDLPIYQQFNTEKLKYKQAITFSLVMNFSTKKKIEEPKTIEVTDHFISSRAETIKVYGNCGMCKESIENMLNSTYGIEKGIWDVDSKMLTVNFDDSIISLDEIKEKLADIGYDTDSHRASKKAYKSLHTCCKYDRP